MRKSWLLVAASISAVSFAQERPIPTSSPPPLRFATYQISDWRTLVPERAAAYKEFRLIVIGNSTYTDDQKIEKLRSKYREIRDEVTKLRRDEYSQYKIIISATNSCRKSSSGNAGSKTCAATCETPPLQDLYTQTDWVSGAYMSGNSPADSNILKNGLKVSASDIMPDDRHICAIELKQSGIGRKVAFSQAEFRIRPQAISEAVDEEVAFIMREVSGSAI